LSLDIKVDTLVQLGLEVVFINFDKSIMDKININLDLHKMAYEEAQGIIQQELVSKHFDIDIKVTNSTLFLMNNIVPLFLNL